MGTKVMGILNVTPDSFSDGGRWLNADAAIAHGRQMFDEGAAVVDVGGESTRPGAQPVSIEEEIARVVPVITGLTALGTVSIDTRHAEVAKAAVGAGAKIINDVSASLYEVAADCGVAWIAMHMQGEPQTMQANPHYDDVVKEVREYLFETAAKAKAAGVAEVMIDPGIGFGKTTEHNLALLRDLQTLTGEYPVVVGASRKAFLGKLTSVGDVVPEATDRLEASIAAACIAANNGAHMVRVHDVKETVRALAIVHAVGSAK